MSIKFDPLPDNRVLSEKVVSRICDAIIGGKLKPGDRLPPERELAGQFGVSRTVVREAIKTLSGRGILRVKRGAGIFVVSAEKYVVGRLDGLADVLPLEGAGVRDLFEIRKTLEANAAEWAARRRGYHHLKRLADIICDAREHMDALRVLSERDAEFHVALAEASHNLVLVRLMLTLLDLMGAARRESLAIPGRARLSLDQHENILRAVQAANPHEARRAMLEHLASVEEAILAPDQQEHLG